MRLDKKITLLNIRLNYKKYALSLSVQSLIIFFILVFGFVVRFYGNNWDDGKHFHPDERMIAIVNDNLEIPNDLDPEFYNYGSFPLIIQKTIAQISDSTFGTEFDNYTNIIYVGRFINTFVDTISILLVFLIAKTLFNPKVGIFSGFIYAISFFPIQNTNFFTVDIIFTFLGLMYFYSLIRFIYTRKKYIYGTLAGISLGLAISTKFTGIIFIPFAPLAFFITYINEIKKDEFISAILNMFKFSFITGLIAIISSFISMPAMYQNWDVFYEDISLQLKMNSDAFIFPYTLQYVDTIMYLYPLYQIFAWGVGPFITMTFLGGFGLLISRIFKIYKNKISTDVILNDIIKNKILLFSISFPLIIFLILGRSEVKFMRYLLIIYPFIAIGAGVFLSYISQKSKETQTYIYRAIFIFILFFTIIWSFSYINIYSNQNTKQEASDWIIANIPENSVIANEHWDDALPTKFGELYTYENLQMYNVPDDNRKWRIINIQLERSDYLILSSNRLYIPIQNLNNCEKYEFRCYSYAADHYKKLLSNTHENFELVAKFENSPTISNIYGGRFGNEYQYADESFTVYDRPIIHIFKNKYK